MMARFLIALMLMTPVTAAAERTPGGTFLELSKREQTLLILGVYGGYRAADAGTFDVRCVEAMDASQLRSMVLEHIRNAPEAWGERIALLVLGAGDAHCAESGGADG